MLGVTIYEMVTEDSAIAALVGDKVYPLVYPSNPTFPCITYRIISGYRDVVPSEEVYTTRVQFDVWSYSYDTTGAIKGELMRLFNYFDGVENSQQIIATKVDLTFDTFEQNVKAHRAVVDVRITHEND